MSWVQTAVTATTASFQAIEKFVFVVTYGRSGSTLIQNLLNSIDGYCIRGENANPLGSLAMAWRAIEGSTNVRNMARNGIATGPDHPWYGAENIAPKRFAQRLAQVFVSEILAPPQGTRVTGFKEIRWANDTRQFFPTLNFARTVFPHARFVFNTRNHDEVARSGWWADQPEDAVKARLAQAETLFKQFQNSHPGLCVHLHYNDYTADHGALKPLFDLLEEPFDRSRINAVMAKPLTHLKGEPDSC